MTALRLNLFPALMGVGLAFAAITHAGASGLSNPPPGYNAYGHSFLPPRPMPYPAVPVPVGPGYGTWGQAPVLSRSPKVSRMPQPPATIIAAASTGGSVLGETREDGVVKTLDEATKAEAKGIVKQFFGRLKGELEAAVKEKGPAHAVGVCQVRAPRIAEELSQETGWNVSRTSLKHRNPANAPDDWEMRVLEQFEVRKAAGEDVKGMTHAEIVQTDGQDRIRFMKAIPTAVVCLACHGESISDDVVAAIDKGYPSDLARGYKLGDVRGAFSLSKPLETGRAANAVTSRPVDAQ